MTSAALWLAQALHAVLLLAAAPVFAGIVTRIESRCIGATGPGILQNWHDLRRLLRKQPVLADGAAWLSEAGPLASLAVLMAAAALVPSFTLGMAASPSADLLVWLGLLVLARAIIGLGAMESGGATDGLAAAQQAVGLLGADLAVLLIGLDVALLTSSTNITEAVLRLHEGGFPLGPVPLALAAGAALLAAWAVADTRPGGADPRLVEASARHLALLRLGDWLRQVIILSLLAALFLPWGLAGRDGATADPAGLVLGWCIGLLAWVGKLLLAALVLGLRQALGHRPAASQRPMLLGTAILLAVLAALLSSIGNGPV